MPVAHKAKCDAVLIFRLRGPLLSSDAWISAGLISMKILELLRRRKSAKKAPLPPIHTIRQPGDVRAAYQARHAKEFEESGIFEKRNPLDNAFMDTGELELQRDSAEMVNPYDTHTWEMDPDEGLRRVDDQHLVKPKKPQGTAGNPYDTIVKKKGW